MEFSFWVFPTATSIFVLGFLYPFFKIFPSTFSPSLPKNSPLFLA